MSTSETAVEPEPAASHSWHNSRTHKSLSSAGSQRSRARSRGSQRSRSHSPHSSFSSSQTTISSGLSGQRGQAWWSVGDSPGLTHQSVGLTLIHQENDETWDLSDSLADLFNEVNKQGEASHLNPQTQTSIKTGNEDVKHVDVVRWIAEDTRHGFIRVFNSGSEENSLLFPCTVSTSAQKLCLQMGLLSYSLHIQLGGDIIRRMEPFDCPLAVQNEYLTNIGYSNIRRLQEEGSSEELSYLVRFYSGKPVSDSTYSRNQLTSYVFVRKGKLIHQWVRRLCIISGTRLLIYRDKISKQGTVVQLAKGSVEEVQVKGQEHVLKVTCTLQGERSLYLAFVTQSDYCKWLKKLKKATTKLPTRADLSNCHLEILPETVFINEDLETLVLRHNVLRERPIEEDKFIIGWLDDLPRFTALRCLNLADNDLKTFPLAICFIKTLVELNLATNKLEEVPSQIAELNSLQILHLHNNCLSVLPEEISSMKNLALLVLAFNYFTGIPGVLLQSQHAQFQIDSIVMAGNQVSRLPTDLLIYMQHIRKVDLRMNRLLLLPTETAKFQSLEHITHLDIRDNQVTDLDIRALRCLEYFNCDHNQLNTLQINGTSLKNLFASHNNLEVLSVSPKPEWLVSMHMSHNKLINLPPWIGDCFFLVHVDVSHNCLKSLSGTLFTDARKLKILKANHNQLTSLPMVVQNCIIEELHLERNQIRSLSHELFVQAHRLRYLNVTSNKLCDLPPPNSNDTFNRLQELYLSFNNLGNEAVTKVCYFPRLRILHLAHNKVSVLNERDLEKLEQLQELNVSSNNLTYLPACLGRHPHLQVLRSNCNLLQELPSFKNSSALKVLEVSSNHLHSISMNNLLSSQVSLLDISGNPKLQTSIQDMEIVKKSKHLSLMDMQDWNGSQPNLTIESFNTHPWISGFSQTSGIRNKLCVTILNKTSLCEQDDVVFALVDGGRNDEVAKAVASSFLTSLKKEFSHSATQNEYLKYTMLDAHKQLKSLGQKLGATAAVLHLRQAEKQKRQFDKKQGENKQWSLHIANVGDTEIILAHRGHAICLTRRFDVTSDFQERQRVVKSGGIITEDGRINGVTFNTRLLGSSYLYPHVIPDPHTTSRVLGHADRFLILANQGLWKFVSHEEAVRQIWDILDPFIAAKSLQDLAQGYGSRENIAIVVIRLLLSEEEKQQIQKSLSVQLENQKELLRTLSQQTDLLELRDGVPPTFELSDVIINRAGRVKKSKNCVYNSHLTRPSSTSDKKQDCPSVSKTWQNHSTSKLYRKKDDNWETVLNRQLADGVMNKELKHLGSGEYDAAGISKERTLNWLAEVNDRKEEEYEAMQKQLAEKIKHREVKHDIDDSSVSLIKEAKYVETAEILNSQAAKLPAKNADAVSTCQNVQLDGLAGEKPQSANPVFSEFIKPPRPSTALKPHVTKPPAAKRTPPPPLPPVLSFLPPFSTVHTASTDSLTSLMDFKKASMQVTNIDRDALLFHQMQMTRAHKGSNTSLTSVQSDPLYASVRDEFHSQTSSHSIEVLIPSEEGSFITHQEADHSQQFSALNSNDVLNCCGEVLENELDVTIQTLYDHVQGKTSNKFWLDHHQHSHEDLRSNNGENEMNDFDIQEDIYATINKDNQIDTSNSTLTQECNRDSSPTYLTPFVPPPIHLPLLTSSHPPSDSVSHLLSNKGSHQNSIIITYL